MTALTVEALAQRISRVDDMIEPTFAKMIALALLPFIERHIAAGQQGAGGDIPLACPWDDGSPSVNPRPIGMVYPMLPDARAFGYLDGSGVEWAAYDTAQMERYARSAFNDGWNYCRNSALATPQPPKPAGAVPLPDRHLIVEGRFMPHPAGPYCLYDDAIRYGDALEAAARDAGRADAVLSDSAQKARDRVKLWFFRDMTDYQRIALLKLFGFPADEMGSHGTQTHGLRHIFNALSAPQQMMTQGEAVDAPSIPLRLIELHGQASQDWELGKHGVVCGGNIQNFERGSARTQIAMFMAPRDDAREYDADAERNANAEFAHGCVTFVREMIARRLTGSQP